MIEPLSNRAQFISGERSKLRPLVSNFLRILTSFIFVVSCRQATKTPALECNPFDCVMIEGKLSSQHIEAVKNTPNLRKIFLNSPGGKTSIATELSKAIYSKEVDAYIVIECSSACFEFLLPATKNIWAIGEPIIAIHGTTQMYRDLYIEDEFAFPSHCPWGSLGWVDQLYTERDYSDNFLEITKENLGHIEFGYEIDSNGCPKNITLNYEHPYWFPNSSQISSELGMEVHGDVCADEPRQCAKRVENLNSSRQCYFGETLLDC